MAYAIDNKEYELIDRFPTSTQRKYGRPDPNDVKVKYQRIDLKTHLQRIRNIHLSTNQVEKKIQKPKIITKVDKNSITNTGIV